MSHLLDRLSLKEGLEKSQTFNDYLNRKAWEKGIPLIGLFELTPRCTLNCRMCYVHLNEKQMPHDELTTEQWISLIDDACDAGMLYATLTGGECMMHPGFRQIYEHLQSRGVLVTILTNGTLMDEETVSWLSERTPQRIQISVYGSSPTGYMAVTGKAEAFYKVNHAIDLVKKSGMPFNLVITVSKQMIGDFEATFSYCKTKKPLSCQVATFMFEARQETGRVCQDYMLTIDEEISICKAILKADGADVFSYPCEEESSENYKHINNVSLVQQKGVPCTAGRARFSISWDGKMTACNIFNFAEAFPLEAGFHSAWKNINELSCKYNMPLECSGCLYKKACISCPAAHWLGVGEGLINPRVCEEGKRMALQGIRKV